MANTHETSEVEEGTNRRGVVKEAQGIIKAEWERHVESVLSELPDQEFGEDMTSRVNSLLTIAGRPELRIYARARLDTDGCAAAVADSKKVDIMDTLNNFPLFFQGGLGGIRRQRKCYLRFAELYPETTDRLLGAFCRCEPHELLAPQKTDVLYAYFKMAFLVDEKDDPYVMDEYGRIDPSYLKR